MQPARIREYVLLPVVKLKQEKIKAGSTMILHNFHSYQIVEFSIYFINILKKYHLLWPFVWQSNYNASLFCLKHFSMLGLLSTKFTVVYLKLHDQVPDCTSNLTSLQNQEVVQALGPSSCLVYSYFHSKSHIAGSFSSLWSQVK